ncbi:MAG: phosphatase PAP2 family protein [Candidatus Zixiibacteriota bacterium]|nr:MAG: phosphatase PAP2 family protein [candidate division Zixibacteria bacterium]
MKLSKITNRKCKFEAISRRLFAIGICAVIISFNFNVSSAWSDCGRGFQHTTPGLNNSLLNEYISQYQAFTFYSTEKENRDYSGRRSDKNLWRDIKGLGSGYVSDSWYIYSSPARLNKKSGILLAAAVAGAALTYAYDREIYDGFKRNLDHPLYRPIRKIGNTFERIGYMGATNKYYFAGMGIGYLFNIKPLEEISIQILEAHFIAGGGKNVANFLVGRWRPRDGNDPRKFEFNNGSSFPSGHVSNIFQLATILSHRVNYLPVTIALYGIAGTVGFQRVTSGSHWPSDVFVAAVYGTAVARAVIYLNERRRNKTSVSPMLDNGSAGIAIIHRF